MPTIGIYVPMGVTRSIAERYDIDPDHHLFDELVRSICNEALLDATGGNYVWGNLDPLCPNREIHRPGQVCRRCLGR